MTAWIDDIVSVVNHVGGKCNSTLNDQLVVFSAKPVKITTRLFVYVTDSLGKQWLAKISFDDDKRLKKENLALDRVSTHIRGSTLESTVPVLYGHRDSIFVQEFLDGSPFSKLTRHYLSLPLWKGLLKQHCLNIIEWLVNFHALQTNSKESVDLIGEMPKGMIHGDFKPSNILICKKNLLHVIDWELFDENGVQIYDLFHFLTYFALTSIRGNRIQAFKYAFVCESWQSQFMNELVIKYCEPIGIPMGKLKKTYAEYLKFVLERRDQLGLLNEGHFMKEIYDYCQSCDISWRAFQKKDYAST